MIKQLSILFLLLAGLCVHAAAQKQLVLLKRQKVVLRLNPGDDFNYKLKGSKSIRRTYVNNISDTAVVTHRDTIPFHKIERLYFPQRKFYNIVGGALVAGGTAFFLIDQINLVIRDEKPSLDAFVSQVSVSSVVVGLPLMLIRKKSQRLTPRYRLLMVKKGSPFFQPDPRGFSSPYIPD